MINFKENNTKKKQKMFDRNKSNDNYAAIEILLMPNTSRELKQQSVTGHVIFKEQYSIQHL